MSSFLNYNVRCSPGCCLFACCPVCLSVCPYMVMIYILMYGLMCSRAFWIIVEFEYNHNGDCLAESVCIGDPDCIYIEWVGRFWLYLVSVLDYFPLKFTREVSCREIHGVLFVFFVSFTGAFLYLLCCVPFLPLSSWWFWSTNLLLAICLQNVSPLLQKSVSPCPSMLTCSYCLKFHALRTQYLRNMTDRVWCDRMTYVSKREKWWK